MPKHPRSLPLWTHFVLLVAVFALVAGVSALYIHEKTYSDAEHAAHRHAHFAAKTAARDLGDELALLKTSVNNLASSPALPAVFKDATGCTLSATDGHIDIIAADGHTVCSSAPPKHRREYRAAWFQQAKRHSILAAPVRDPATGRYALAYAAPIKGGGVVAGVFDLEVIAPDLARKYAGGEPFLFSISDGKRILARSMRPHDYVGKPVLNATPPTGDFTAQDRDGITRYFTQTLVPGVGWRFVAGEEASAATAPGRALERRQFGILLVGLLLMLVATSAVYALLTIPIRRMRQAVSTDRQLPTTGPRELGALAGDINAMLTRQDALRQAQKMEALGRLASGIAHDFNNLLLVIASGARTLMRRAELDPKSTETVGRIDRAAHRGQQLTTQLLAFARQRALAPVPTNVNVVVREMLLMLDRLIGKSITTNIELTPELPLVLIDEGQLAQVILNLSINARDAMPDGGTLTISTSGIEVNDDDSVPGRYVLLEVRDTGVGMDEATLQRVFDPFFTTKDDGTGLGLATVHGIVTGAGGFIDARSTLGEGTVFSIRFPGAQIGEDLLATSDHEALK